MMTNRSNGTLYVGVTSDLPRRVWEHRQGVADGYAQAPRPSRLVLAEHYDDVRIAIQREYNIKHWPRLWKLRIISARNPEWDDLYEHLT